MQINNKPSNLSFKSSIGDLDMNHLQIEAGRKAIAERNQKIKEDMQLHPENYRRITPEEKQAEIKKNKTEAAIVLGLVATVFTAWVCHGKKIFPFNK